MSENKFIKHLRGESTPGSLVELQNQNTPTSFADMPQGTSNPNVKYSDHRGNAVVVAKGTQNWKLSGSSLLLATNVNGDGNDYTGEFDVSGNGLWIDATYTFPSTGDPAHPVAAVFNAGTKWVLKLCGHNLLSDNKTIDFTLLVKLGSTNIMTKNFTITEKALQFCEEFIIDYDESIQTLIKASGTSTLTLQLLCNDSTASATIYNGMTVLTALQRGVDASAVSASFGNVEEIMHDGLLPNDYFSNAAYIDQVQDGDKAYAVFQRDGDEMNLAGWDEPIPSQTGNSGKYLTTDGSDMSWHQITASDVGALPDSTKYGASFSLSMNSSTFVITAQLKDQDGNNLGSAQTIDLPLESVVVNGSYDNATKSLILTLENGNTITIPVADLISGLQEELVSGTNIKTINGNSILGAGNLQVSGFLPYEAGWTTNSTTKAFCDDIAADSSAVVGNAYLGEVTINDMPAGIGNAEIKAYILDGTNASNKVIQLELTSGNVAPYKWIYTYWNGGSNVSGWTTWQEPLVSGTNIKTVNSTSLLGSGDITIDGLPTQTGQGGKYLTTDGSTASWAAVDALPTQTGNSGKLLTTNGTSASWTEIKTINSGSLVGSGNIDVLVNEATPASSLGIGYTTINTTYTDSINIGNGAQVGANNALALGAFASAEGADSIAIYSSTGTAHRARTTHTGNIAIGYNALAINAPYTIAIGYNAFAQSTNAIQLGTGQNASSGTMQVWTYRLLNKTTGLIPSARLADQTSATQGQALILDANLDGQWTTLATVATSGSYNDLLDKPTIPTVNDATLTIQKNGSDVATFTANSSTNTTANITVPTDTGDLTNNAGFITKSVNDLDNYTLSSALATVATSGAYSDLSGTPSLATVATSGDYDDLLNKPTIPAAQVNSDWNAVSGVAQILNKPSLAAVATSGAYSDLSGTPNLAAVATSGSYSDLSGTPTIPTKLSELTGDVDISSATAGQHLVYDGSKWKNTTSSASVSWGGITGTLSDQTDLQNALNAKQATITGAATTITTNNLSAARALVSDSTGKVAVSTVTSTELGYMHGVTSNVQTQLNNKQATLTAGNGIDITGATISVDNLDCGTM